MLSIAPAYQTHLDQEVTQLATCWRVIRRDSQVFGFTDYPVDLVLSGVTYSSALGYSASDIAASADLAVDNLELQGILDSPAITEADLMAGLWDYAEVFVFEVIPTLLSAGTRPLKRGRIGEVSVRRTSFVAELRGLSQAFSRVICEVTSPTCRADLGDTRCAVALGPITVTGTVTAVTSARQWTDSGRGEAAGWFDLGRVTWTSGPNNGLSMEVKTHTAGGVIGLALPMPYAIAVGNTYSMIPGCDKRLNTCGTKFLNVVNFRGEPHLPGIDALLRGP